MTFRASQSGCPNVVEYVDSEHRYADKSTVIVLGRPADPTTNLAIFIKKTHGMHEWTAKFIFRQLVSAVAHCRSVGIMHCDIKPLNVLIEQRTGRVVLIDFGLAEEAGLGFFDGPVGEYCPLPPPPSDFFFYIDPHLRTCEGPRMRCTFTFVSSSKQKSHPAFQLTEFLGSFDEVVSWLHFV